MNDITYVGLDVHKATVCVAIAESGRGGEVREVGVFENRPDASIKASRRSVLTRSPAFIGISDGATTTQSCPKPVSKR